MLYWSISWLRTDGLNRLVGNEGRTLRFYSEKIYKVLCWALLNKSEKFNFFFIFGSVGLPREEKNERSMELSELLYCCISLYLADSRSTLFDCFWEEGI